MVKAKPVDPMERIADAVEKIAEALILAAQQPGAATAAKPAVVKPEEDDEVSKANAVLSGPVDAQIGDVRIEGLEKYSRKGKLVLHILNIEGGKLKGVSEGASYRIDSLPAVLRGVAFGRSFPENNKEEAA